MNTIHTRLLATAASLLIGVAAEAQTAEPPVPSSPGSSVGSTGPGAAYSAGNAYAGPIMTRWGKKVTAENAWRSYPRPQMVREDWTNLNGEWDYAIVKSTDARPAQMQGKILVPFAVESRLSGVQRKVLPDDRIWYRRSFKVPAAWNGKNTLLHFGAVDFESTVSVNGAIVGSHEGGSDPFTFDVTAYLRPGDNELVVQVTDPTSTGSQPRGKQTLEPRGIWYTAVSGIWQTVWLEPVSRTHIDDVNAVADIDKGSLDVAVSLSGAGTDTQAVRLTARAKGKVIATGLMRGNRRTTLLVPNPRLWSPDDPFLYDLTVELVDIAAIDTRGRGKPLPGLRLSQTEADLYAGAKVTSAPTDKVETYFAMRKTSVGRDPSTGRPALLLNNKPIFQNGTLDQGWWPESLLTPPSEEAARYDMEFLKKSGFNMLRKHIKVEPARYYYDADHLGMLIWQDMPSGAFADQSVAESSDREATASPATVDEYQSELTRMIGALRPFPSIVMWVTNNEGWGQYDANGVASLAKRMDPSRVVNATSGWFDSAGTVSDVYDIHTYAEVPSTPAPHGDRPVIIGEYGGIGLIVPGHLWFPERRQRIYQIAADPADFLARYKVKFDEIVRQRRAVGLNAAVYTQTTDVESEVNGLMTYDREDIKIPTQTLAKMSSRLRE